MCRQLVSTVPSPQEVYVMTPKLACDPAHQPRRSFRVDLCALGAETVRGHAPLHLREDSATPFWEGASDHREVLLLLSWSAPGQPGAF